MGARNRGRLVAAGLSLALLVGGLVAIQSPTAAQALDGSQFNAGHIIDDSKFYDGNALSQAQIQSFLESKQPGACGANGCLKSYVTPTTSQPSRSSSATGNLVCSAYPSEGNESAARIIFKVQQACGISARVILVTLQKEEALITGTSPTLANLRIAMGYACPDHGAVCDTKYYGFFNQIYWGTWQLKVYKAGRFARQPGVQEVAYSTVASCGSKTVNVDNYATAALYNYTPYTPNAAALANLYGTAPCGAYGNRNFWVYYNQWFGGPSGDPTGALQTVTGAANSLSVTGWAVDPDVLGTAINVRVRGNGWSTLIPAGGANAAADAAVPGAGPNHGFAMTVTAAPGTQSVCADAENQSLGTDINLGCTTVTVGSVVTSSSRVAGTDRYDTAVQISQKNFAAGVPVAYIASGENFPDALSAVPIAAARRAPLLLATSAAVPANVLAELARLQPQQIVVVGGPSAISASAFAQLSSVSPSVVRISGTDRFGTSIAVGSSLYGPANPATTAYIATGANFPDAISAASAAGSQRAPLLLVDGSATAVPSAIADSLRSFGVTKLVIVGGEAAISAGMTSALGAFGTVTRIAGPDRYSTSASVNAAAFPAATSAYLATGTAYADGLTGGAVAGANSVPLFLSPQSCVPASVIDQMVRTRTATLTLLGGASALGDGVSGLMPC
ncbi:cell wall-binding repeat-containing protein [Lacisediminihabitans changchengi]|uniref:Cell wall-binding repeat-containing protein n=1 Tax=Lacisediminihabitans changchengi TaxID=2787634 RepID=A0A934SH13_9MICO|nr:cell wall-binding repeat-containing protein [Lacisediminihabitans changchengi]MBK4346476.1 cell wall-binding repeat-containing protein [Lacisediminihabitans changchengi]MBK4348896.1 cell wall-binding repeat-containing protein [Lacisediminihabitans changchengi]